ncbi:N-formylglutamate amidohydrolase [Dongia sp.]|uniref:N-formylglutamate amidohydrolase n=1 Tax=Dongia sp. TaxID=1977262 RepID=UPI0035B3D051
MPNGDFHREPASTATQLDSVASGEAILNLVRPLAWRAPVIVASPHSGQSYPPEFLASAGLSRQELRLSEDCYVDELVAAAPDLGVPLLAALFPRSFCDVNREPLELDPAMFSDRLPEGANTASPRVAAGLGVVPRLGANDREIYRRKLSFAEAEARLARYYRPYHAALNALCSEAMALFGVCLVLDCHSMPSVGGPHDSRHAGNGRVDFVLGDCFGASCASAVTAAIDAYLRAGGANMRRNSPYSGGFVTQHYGRPATGIHVLQLEINRALYVHERSLERSAGFAAVQATMTGLITMLSEKAAELLKE